VSHQCLGGFIFKKNNLTHNIIKEMQIKTSAKYHWLTGNNFTDYEEI
jgi:hypothetical protein